MRSGEYRDYIEDMTGSIRDIEIFIKGMDFSSFVKDKKTVNAVLRSLEIMGEAAKKVPTDFREKYKQVDWKGMAGMRDRLIHEYDTVDYDAVWKVVTKEVPPLRQQIEKIIRTESASDKN